MTVTANGGLATVPANALALAQTGAFDLAKLQDLIAAPPVERPVAFPELPKPPDLTDSAREALDAVPRQFGSFHLTERRALTTAELAKLTAEAQTLSQVVKPLADRLEAIKETVRTHMDVAAETAGLAIPAGQSRGGVLLREATPRIQGGKAAGHYLLAGPATPHKVPVAGFEQEWEQRYTKGKAAPSRAALAALLDEGEITRQEFLAFTRESRQLDTDRIAAFIRKNPARGTAILAAITTRDAPGASLITPLK